jgi:peroxisomal 3,2-trans-enoyl-CoA isomerase
MTTLKEKMAATFANMPDASNNVLFELRGNRLWVTFNRPKRYNAFSMDMYTKLTNNINEVNKDDKVKFIILTGSGGNFSSGNDLKNFAAFPSIDATIEELSKTAAEVIFDLTEAIIRSSKPIFAIVEGQCIGFAFTQLLLYDRVFTVEGSEFTAPLVKLAQGPEMCSSFTFPKFFGQRLGEQLITGGIKVDPAFLHKHGVADACKSRKEAEQQLEQHLSELDELDWASYLAARRLFREVDRSILHKVNRLEADNLTERWSNPELLPFLMNYLSKAKAKPKL